MYSRDSNSSACQECHSVCVLHLCLLHLVFGDISCVSLDGKITLLHTDVINRVQEVKLWSGLGLAGCGPGRQTGYT